MSYLFYKIERGVTGIEHQPALHFIRSIGNDAIAQANDYELQLMSYRINCCWCY